jgi:hypothetical protein
MTAEFLTLNLQDLETLIAKSNCGCHFINPNKTRLILWKEIKEDATETYYLRIGIQKFISYPLKDKNKALYWRFNGFEKGGNKEGVHSEPSQTQKVEPTITNPDPHNPVTKYQQRIAKTQELNHGKSNSTVNSSEHSESTSH